MKFENPHADRGIGFDHCGDCAIEAKIYSEYKAKHDPDFDVKEAVVNIGRITGRGLLRELHGTNY
jgi:hypothetical protein